MHHADTTHQSPCKNRPRADFLALFPLLRAALDRSVRSPSLCRRAEKLHLIHPDGETTVAGTRRGREEGFKCSPSTLRCRALPSGASLSEEH